MQTLPVRIGVLVPSLDPVVEHDFQRFMPAAASFHVARLDQSASSKPANDESLARMCDQAPERARPLADLGAELIMFCCTSGSFLRGFGWDRELARRIEEAVGVPALTTSSAVAEALAALGIRRIFMVTPYPRSANEREQAFFNAHGVEIPAFTSFECEHSHDIDKVTPGAIVERVLAHRAAIDDCEGVRELRATRDGDRRAPRGGAGQAVITSNASAFATATADGHDVPADAHGRVRFGAGRRAMETVEHLRDFFRRVSEPIDPRYIPLYEPRWLAMTVELMARAIEWTPGGSVQLLSGYRGTKKRCGDWRRAVSWYSGATDIDSCRPDVSIEFAWPISLHGRSPPVSVPLAWFRSPEPI